MSYRIEVDLDRSQPLYYECHITIDPVTGALERTVADFAKIFEFRLAEFEMTKPNTVDSFLTARSKDAPQLRRDMIALIYLLRRASVQVRRYKIELALVDSNFSNVYGLTLAVPPGAQVTPKPAVESGLGDTLDKPPIP